MNRHFNIIIFGLLVAGKAYCQSEETSRFSPQESFRELTAGVGLHAPLKGDNFGNTESCYVLDYAVYGYSGIGFHGGLKYIPEIRGISDCFEVPIKIAWRSPLRGRNRWREQWPEAVASTIEPRESASCTVASPVASAYRVQCGHYTRLYFRQPTHPSSK